MGITHPFVSAVTDGSDATKVRPSNWNAAHTVADASITRAALADDAKVPTGAITMWPTAVAPTGWLLCDGTAVSRATYAALFALIGTTYGAGDASTTFNVPNLKGKVPVGLDGSQTEFDALAETGGAKTHTLSTAEMPAHTHTQDAHAHSHFHNVPGDDNGSASVGATFVRGQNVDNQQATSTDATGATATNQNTGGGGAHNNLQPYLVLNFVIRT